jgi:hypothetical protein
LGIPDAEIAKMLGKTIGSLSLAVVVDEGFASARDPEAAKREAAEEAARLARRRELDRKARGLTTWHAEPACTRNDQPVGRQSVS